MLSNGSSYQQLLCKHSSSPYLMWQSFQLCVGNRRRAAAHECVACEPPFRSLQISATQQTRQPAAVVAWHQHCCGCRHSESWTQNHASCLWASWTWAVPGQRAKQERCLCHLWPQRQRPDWGMSSRMLEKLCRNAAVDDSAACTTPDSSQKYASLLRCQ